MEAWMSLVEAMYLYRMSGLFNLHLVALLVLGVFIIFLIIRKRQLSQLDKSVPFSKCHDTAKYVDYQKIKKRTTAEYVTKLQKTEKYKNYEKKKNQGGYNFDE